MKLSFLGFLIATSVIVLAVVLSDGTHFFCDTLSLLLVVFLTTGLSVASFGARDTCDALSLCKILFTQVAPQAKHITILKTLRHYVYASGVIGTLIGWIVILNSYIDSSELFAAISVSLLTLFYSTLISELIFMPSIKACEKEILEN